MRLDQDHAPACGLHMMGMASLSQTCPAYRAGMHRTVAGIAPAPPGGHQGTVLLPSLARGGTPPRSRDFFTPAKSPSVTFEVRND